MTKIFLSKKGDITLQQVVLIVIAVIMIFIVTSFGAKIWGVFFPSADKSTMASFTTLHSVINAKSVKSLSYDMTPLVLYLGKDNCIVYFYGSSPAVTHYEKGIPITYHKPDSCQGKPCLCLYDDDPSNDIEDKEDDLIECKTVQNPMNTKDDMNYLKGALCGGSAKYFPVMIMRYTDSGDKSNTNTPYLYILEDNEENRKKHETWNIPMCNDNSICDGKRDGEILAYTDSEGLNKVYAECAKVPGNSYASTSLKCIYNKNTRACSTDCSIGDVKPECAGEYKTCSDYNGIIGPEPYISMDNSTTDYKYYHMCKNDVQYCNRGCGVYDWTVYILKDAQMASPDGSVKSTDTTIFKDDIKELCKPIFANVPSSKYGAFLKSYNNKDDNCIEHFNKYFYAEPSTFMACKQNNGFLCENFAKTNPVCDLKYISRGNIYWITYADPECADRVKDNFETAYMCDAKASAAAK